MFTNPEDLEISIGEDKESGKFSIGIFRGPRRNYRPLLTSEPFAETLEEAVETAAKILEIVRNVGTEVLEDSTSIIAGIVNPSGEAIDQSEGFNEALIRNILSELRAHRTARTCDILAPKV
jgi:hypothetical protein